ncbi:MAG: ABC transporter ATP-binding protein [Acutalibacteraceae bacterium]
MELLRAEHLSFSYENGHSVIRDISFSVQSREFIIVCGETGCGKTTLLRLLKQELKPKGVFDGEVYFNGTAYTQLDEKTAACSVGFVMQNPDSQIITDKVWHELAFGLESIGLKNDVIKRRIAETACFFGLEDLINKSIFELSGGQKQMLNLAAVMIMQPKLLLLDEPTAQLDPISRKAFLNILHEVNREFHTAVMIVEHNLDGILELCDRLMVLEEGQILYNDTPQKVCQRLDCKKNIFRLMPSAVQITAPLCRENEDCALTAKTAVPLIERHTQVKPITLLPSSKLSTPLFSFKDIWFRYEEKGTDILKGLSLDLCENEILFVLGGNGSGKSTFLNIAAGIYREYSGKIRLYGKKLTAYKNQSLYKDCLAFLPQDVTTVFVKDSIREDLQTVNAEKEIYGLDISAFLDRHPYDLSGGEQQLCAFVKVLATKPKILLLDEPTKGADAVLKGRIADILLRLKAEGLTLLVVSHDTEFAALCADRCALLFNGEIVSVDEPHRFFAKNHFYTTPTNKVMRSFDENIITVKEAVKACGIYDD